MNLLTDPLFTLNSGEMLSLPGVLAASTCDEPIAFSRVRAHQRTAWHMFRVQLAALALREGGLAEPPHEVDAWVDMLRALTPEYGDDPWRLVVEDRTRPAFLQPPDPSNLKWKSVPTPDALDMLITSRNHDLKQAVAVEASPEDWIHALVTLQTSEGYGGSRNYGIARMNGGSSSRPFLGLAPIGPTGTLDPASWWRRDVKMLLRRQNDETPLTRGGPAVLWCQPWKEGQSIPVQTIDPWAIEVCRRVRLIERDGRLVAEKTGSKAARIESKTFKGAVGDPWAPISIADKEPKALTLSEGRFDYVRIVKLMMSGDWVVPMAAQVQPGEEAVEMALIAEALSRGNSKTDGLKSRVVPLPRRARALLVSDTEILSEAAATQMQEIKAADGALRDAIALYVAGGERSEKLSKKHYRRASDARARLDEVADGAFFEHLWSRTSAEANGSEESNSDAELLSGQAFRDLLVQTARSELDRAFGSIPCTSIRAPRARARARSRLEGGLRRAALVETVDSESDTKVGSDND